MDIDDIHFPIDDALPVEPTAIQMAQALLDAELFDTADATPVTGFNSRARFFVETSDASTYEYEVIVIRRPKPLQAKLQCCGVWIDYPTLAVHTHCPKCKSTFAIARS